MAGSSEGVRKLAVELVGMALAVAMVELWAQSHNPTSWLRLRLADGWDEVRADYELARHRGKLEAEMTSELNRIMEGELS